MIPQTKPLITQTDIDEVVKYLANGGWLTEYIQTKIFEDKISKFLNVKHAILVPSGTIGLYLSLLAVEITNGAIAVPDLTMAASALAPAWIGLSLDIIDVDRRTLCIDISELEQIIHRVDAVIYVSLNGRCGDIEYLKRLCNKYGVVLIEDACQALGSKHNKKSIGTFGDIGVFSLSPHKIITTGQGGIIVTDNDKIAEKIRRVKDFGREAPGVDFCPFLGLNFKFTDLQAVIGVSQFNTIADRIDTKIRIFDKYKSMLDGICQFVDFEFGNVPWFVDVYFDSERERNDVYHHLIKSSIMTRLMYPPISEQPFAKRISVSVSKSSISRDFSGRGLWLPSYLSITDEEIETVCREIRSCLKS